MHRHMILPCLLLVSLSWGIVQAQDRPEKMSREDVVLVPAIGEGLCVRNVFQTNMVSDGKFPGFAIACKDRHFYPADVNWYADGSVDTTAFRLPRSEATLAELKSIFEKSSSEMQKEQACGSKLELFDIFERNRIRENAN
jgi:hypothetical protein